MTGRSRTALVVVDMQRDFCARGGWVDQLGEDVANTAGIVPAVAAALARARALGLPVIHTREGHRPDLSDLHPNKRWRTRAHGLGIGDLGREGRILVRGEPGWEIVPELAPAPGEAVVDKPGKSAFHATGLDADLRAAGIAALLVCGVTTDCCVQATVRDAADLGYRATLLADCCAAVERENHDATLAILRRAGGRIGTVQDGEAAFGPLEAGS